MSRIYVDKNQVVFVDEDAELDQKISPEIVKSRINVVMDRQSVITNWFNYMYSYINGGISDNSIVYRCFSKMTFTQFLEDVIQQSLHYFKKAGLEVDYDKYDARIKLKCYKPDESGQKESNEYPIYSLNTKNWSGSGYFTDKLGHVCIFCVKKEGVVGGNIEFFPLHPRSSSVISLRLFETSCSSTPQALTIRLQTGSVVVLSGDVYHRIEKMKMMNVDSEMIIVEAEFYYEMREYPYVREE